jgi:cell division protein FtsB
MKSRRSSKSILPDLIFSKFFLIFFVIIFIAVLFGLAKGTVKNHLVNNEMSDLEKDIIQLEKENQEFAQLINYLKTDSFIEQEAKLKLGYKKEGENLIIIPNGEFNPEEVNNETKDKTSNPSKWWAYFFK